MAHAIKVSVCIPVYNVEKYIERCARSLFEQTLRDDMEFIFADDCSSDGSVGRIERVLAEYQGKGICCKIVRLPRNGGRVAARLAALRIATGAFVSFCDADDWVEPNCYELLHESICREGSDIAICSYSDVDARGNKKARRLEGVGLSPCEFVRQAFYSPGFSSLWNKMFTRQVACEWLSADIPDLCVGEDLLMNLLAYEQAKSLSWVPIPLYCYQKSENSISSECSRRSVDSALSCIRLIQTRFSIVPKEALDIFRVHALWDVMKCGKYQEDFVRKVVSEYSLNVFSAPRAPLVKRIVLSLARVSVRLATRLIRLVERMRRGIDA